MISRWLAAGMETFPVNPTDDGGLHGNGDRNGLAGAACHAGNSWAQVGTEQQEDKRWTGCKVALELFARKVG